MIKHVTATMIENAMVNLIPRLKRLVDDDPSVGVDLSRAPAVVEQVSDM